MIESLIDMNWPMYLISSLAGYLAGSISFARLLTFLVTRSETVNQIDRELPGDEPNFQSDSISATVVNLNLGKKYGCLTVILDMVKVAIPTWLMFHLFPLMPYYFLTALFGMVGHIYPVYHKFQGGRGQSPLLGGLLIINWFGILIANLAAVALGYITGAVLVMRWGWMILMIFWFAWRFQDPWHVGFIILANALFWFSMRREIRRFLAIRNSQAPSQEQISDFLLMGKKLGSFIDHYSLPVLIRKLFKREKDSGTPS